MFLGVPMWVLGIAAIVPAVLFAFVRPHRAATGPSGRVARWGHPVAWTLLSAACFVRLLVPGDLGGDLAVATAFAGLIAYLGFVGAVSVGSDRA